MMESFNNTTTPTVLDKIFKENERKPPCDLQHAFSPRLGQRLLKGREYVFLYFPSGPS
jgi:hypothetical protein